MLLKYFDSFSREIRDWSFFTAINIAKTKLKILIVAETNTQQHCSKIIVEYAVFLVHYITPHGNAGSYRFRNYKLLLYIIIAAFKMLYICSFK